MAETNTPQPMDAAGECLFTNFKFDRFNLDLIGDFYGSDEVTFD